MLLAIAALVDKVGTGLSKNLGFEERFESCQIRETERASHVSECRILSDTFNRGSMVLQVQLIIPLLYT